MTDHTSPPGPAGRVPSPALRTPQQPTALPSPAPSPGLHCSWLVLGAERRRLRWVYVHADSHGPAPRSPAATDTTPTTSRAGALAFHRGVLHRSINGAGAQQRSRYTDWRMRKTTATGSTLRTPWLFPKSPAAQESWMSKLNCVLRAHAPRPQRTRNTFPLLYPSFSSLSGRLRSLSRPARPSRF